MRLRMRRENPSLRQAASGAIWNTSRLILDFTMKDGNTEYEVVGWFDPDAEETVMQKVIRRLMGRIKFITLKC